MSSGVGTNSGSFLGGMQDSTNAHPTATSFDPSIMNSANGFNRPPPGPQQTAERSQNFIHSLANVLYKQGAPLPPALSGIPNPNYDHSTSPYNDIEPSQEPGYFRLAGKDVDIFRLWGAVQQRGGYESVRLVTPSVCAF